MANLITIKLKDEKMMRLLKNKNLTQTFERVSKPHFFAFRKKMNKLLRDEFISPTGSYESLGIQSLIKGHSRPLVQSGSLGSSVSDDELKIKASGVVGFKVGFYKGKVGNISVERLASIIHDGREWRPTLAQRQRLQAKIHAAGGAPPSGERKSVYKIPARPFLKTVMERPEVRQSFAYTSINAFMETLKVLAK